MRIFGASIATTSIARRFLKSAMFHADNTIEDPLPRAAQSLETLIRFVR